MLVVRYQVADDGVAEVVGAVEAAFAGVAAEKPEGIRWAYCRRANEFVGLLDLEEGAENPLPRIRAARELQSAVARWAVGDDALVGG